jgi:hypothetical protein
MRRRSFIVSVMAAMLGGSIDLGACGDKFLRIGRSARFRRYAAMYPSAILIYSPANATRAGIDELKALLKRAGHKPVAIDRRASVSAALSASPYDILMADYQDTEALKADLPSAASPALLPILSTESKALEREARQRYAYLIKPHAMTKYDALAEVDRLMETRRRASAAR